MRLIPFRIPSFDELGLPEVIERWVRVPRGLVIATGPTGAGKSTTLASIVDRINQQRPCHIITIEDPIEYVHQHNMAAIEQREVGLDTSSFVRGIRAALRADPDVLLVGEMRDLDTIQTTLTMAETGHLVLGTLHTNDTSQAVDRLVDVFPTGRQAQIRVQLANSLTGIVYQQLLPRIDGGQVAAFEVMVATHATRSLIRDGKSNQLRNVLAHRSERRDADARAGALGPRHARRRHLRRGAGAQPVSEGSREADRARSPSFGVNRAQERTRPPKAAGFFCERRRLAAGGNDITGGVATTSWSGST